MEVGVIFLKDVKGRVTAYCPALELTTYGKSLSHAQKMFDEALELFVDDVSGRDAWDEVFEELGWSKQNNKWLPPQLISTQLQTISVRRN